MLRQASMARWRRGMADHGYRFAMSLLNSTKARLKIRRELWPRAHAANHGVSRLSTSVLTSEMIGLCSDGIPCVWSTFVADKCGGC